MNGFDPSDPGAIAGTQYRIWFGTYNGGEGSPQSDWGVIFDSLGWGTDSPNYGTFAASVNSGWEGVLGLEGNPVPEPGIMLFLGSGSVGIYALGRKRFKK